MTRSHTKTKHPDLSIEDALATARGWRAESEECGEHGPSCSWSKGCRLYAAVGGKLALGLAEALYEAPVSFHGGRQGPLRAYAEAVSARLGGAE